MRAAHQCVTHNCPTDWLNNPDMIFETRPRDPDRRRRRRRATLFNHASSPSALPHQHECNQVIQASAHLKRKKGILPSSQQLLRVESIDSVDEPLGRSHSRCGERNWISSSFSRKRESGRRRRHGTLGGKFAEDGSIERERGMTRWDNRLRLERREARAAARDDQRLSALIKHSAARSTAATHYERQKKRDAELSCSTTAAAREKGRGGYRSHGWIADWTRSTVCQAYHANSSARQNPLRKRRRCPFAPFL